MQLFAWTGNPFVDNGIATMLAHCGKSEPEQLTQEDAEQMRFVMLRIYLSPPWLKAMQNIFPNGAFTNGAYANPPGKRREIVEALLKFLTDEIQPTGESGGCVCCGRRSPLRLEKNDTRKLPNNMVLSKTYIPLNGGVLNFFPAGVYGADVCAACVFAIQCAPLSFYTCNYDEKRFFALHSNTFNLVRWWADLAKKEIDVQAATGNWNGPFNKGYNNAHNAFFHVVETIMGEHDFQDENRFTLVRLYHFDNYNQPKSQPLKIYDMPASVFQFLLEVKNSSFADDWRKLVWRNFYFMKSGQIIPLALVDETPEQDEKRRVTKNLVLEKLLRGDRITHQFFGRRRAYAPWGLLEIYLREVLQMPDERMATIKRVADDIGDMIVSTDNKKRLAQIEMASSYASFRNVLRLISKERLKAENPVPLFTFDEYVDQLFPQGSLQWRETQDLILFRLYEKLHGFLRPEDLPDTEEHNSTAEDNNGEKEQ